MIRSLALLGWLFLSLVACADLTRGPYLQLAHPEGVTVVWRTGSAMSDPQVRFWIPGEEEAAQVCRGEAILPRTTTGSQPLSSAPEGTVQYEATISGLSPATTYQYVIHDGEEALTEAGKHHQFTTHPPAGTPVPTRVWVVGDSGTGEIHQRLVHDAMLHYTASTKRPLDLYLHVGDMAYSHGTDPQFQERFFAPYQETLGRTVCWASMGNHEGHSSDGKKGIGPFYDAYVCPTNGEAGGVPSGSEAFYSFDHGQVHFICLNSYDLDRRPTGRMAQWLQRDLAATQSRWIIAYWHHPPYTKGTHNSDTEKELVEMRKFIMPILEEGGVDLVLSGHSHIYERSMLIDGAYVTPTTAEGVILDDGDGRPDGDGPYRKSVAKTPHNGTVAVVTGHGGALGRNSLGVMPIMRSIVLDHGSTILDIEGDTLTGTMLDLRGKERDRFAIVKEGEVKQEVVAAPWTATRATEERTGEGVLGAPGTVKAAKKAAQAGKKNQAKLIPAKVKNLIPPHAEWAYLAGGEEPETEMWTKLGFDVREEGWKIGRAGFGYGDGDDRTVLNDMKSKGYTTVFIRREFDIPAGTNLKKLGLVINYDDGFVLHVNGREVLSKQVSRNEDGSVEVTPHEGNGAEYFRLAEFAEAFTTGRNVVAFEGHNWSNTSTDFTLDPYLVVEIGK